MASSPGAIPAELSAVHEAARSSLVSALQEASTGESAAPSAPEQAAPAPAPAAPEQTAAPAAPAGESPSQTAAVPDSPEGSPPSAKPAPITINPSDLSPEARRFLDMKGGDVNRALADALEYNNRLGKHAPEQGAQESLAPPVQAPPAPVAIDPAVIEQHVDQFLAKDQDSVSIVSSYRSVTAQLGDVAAREKVVAAELTDHLSWLKLPEVQAEPFRKQEIESKVRQLQADASLLRLDRGNLQRDKRDLEMAYESRAEQYRSGLLANLQKRDAEARQKAEREKSIEDHARTLESTWPTTLEQIGKDKQLTPKQIARLGKRAQDAALARLDQGLGPIEDVRGFLEQEATAFVEDLVEYHREQSARYATQTEQRAAQPGSTGAPSGVTEAGQPEFKSLEDVKAAARKDAMARLSLR